MIWINQLRFALAHSRVAQPHRYTADQLAALEAAQQRDLDQVERRSAAGGIRTP